MSSSNLRAASRGTAAQSFLATVAKSAAMSVHSVGSTDPGLSGARRGGLIAFFVLGRFVTIVQYTPHAIAPRSYSVITRLC
jgi:hypothetical protein